VRRLRAKLGAEHEALIGTVRNVGYRFVPLKPEEGRGHQRATGTGAPGDGAPAEPARGEDGGPRPAAGRIDQMGRRRSSPARADR